MGPPGSGRSRPGWPSRAEEAKAGVRRECREFRGIVHDEVPTSRYLLRHSSAHENACSCGEGQVPARPVHAPGGPEGPRQALQGQASMGRLHAELPAHALVSQGQLLLLSAWLGEASSEHISQKDHRDSSLNSHSSLCGQNQDAAQPCPSRWAVSPWFLHPRTQQCRGRDASWTDGERVT